jgi:3-methyladenine DNA glycosylase AlkD
VINAIAKKYFTEIKDINNDEIFRLCEDFWRSGYMEESIIACRWSYAIRKRFEPKDFRVLERWVMRYVSNWATCDTLCNHTVGAFLERYPDHLPRLKRWARSKNRWARRAAAVSLIVPARKGALLRESLEIADILLGDTDDMVQKGYGWLLKSASRRHEREIFEYVMSRRPVMPRRALRYAIETMKPELKARAMEKA